MDRNNGYPFPVPLHTIPICTYRQPGIGTPQRLQSPRRKDFSHRSYLQEAALVNGIASSHLSGSASIVGEAHDAQVQRQLFLIHPADTQAQRESP